MPCTTTQHPAIRQRVVSLSPSYAQPLISHSFILIYRYSGTCYQPFLTLLGFALLSHHILCMPCSHLLSSLHNADFKFKSRIECVTST